LNGFSLYFVFVGHGRGSSGTGVCALKVMVLNGVADPVQGKSREMRGKEEKGIVLKHT